MGGEGSERSNGQVSSWRGGCPGGEEKRKDRATEKSGGEDKEGKEDGRRKVEKRKGKQGQKIYETNTSMISKYEKCV